MNRGLEILLNAEDVKILKKVLLGTILETGDKCETVEYLDSQYADIG